MSSVTPIVTLLWGGLCTVWVILLLAQRRLRRQGLLLAATPAEPCPRDQQAWPPVHAVVPARNEARTIESCVRHLLAQDYPNLRVVVVNDRSEDDTAERIERIARLDSRLQLRTARSLPEGWLAKSHALWLGTRELTLGEFDGDAWLLFIDADATLGMGAVRSAVVEAQRRAADLLTLFPRNAALGFWEHLIIPLCGGIVALWFARPGRPFANGQFLLVRRATYERVGGHAAVRDALIEDVPLAEACAASGATIVTAGGAELLGVRMYDSFGGVCDGWTRIFAGALRSPLKLIVSLLWLTFGSLLPHVALPPLIAMTIAAPNGATLLLLTLCLQHLALIYLVSYRFWSMGRCDRRYLWLYPASVLIVSGLLVRAIWMLTVGRTVTWRGVHYRLDGHARLRPLSSTHLERRSFRAETSRADVGSVGRAGGDRSGGASQLPGR